MTDKFMSGWGKADGKINKLVLPARSVEEAYIIEANAKDRSEMKHVNIRTTVPYYNPKVYFVSYHDWTEYKPWYSPDRPFRKLPTVK